VKAGFYHFGLVGRGVEAELGEEDCGGIHAFWDCVAWEVPFMTRRP